MKVLIKLFKNWKLIAEVHNPPWAIIVLFQEDYNYSMLRMQLPDDVIGFERNSAFWTFDVMFISVLISVDV